MFEQADPFILSRIQFAANITFHILFPTITIALGWILLFFKLRFNATGDDKWMSAYRLYVKVFALCFALGVVSGITMSFQFGTNWPGFMKKVGNIAGPLLAYEVLTAFFLEAVFLGIMLFGYHRVSRRVHTAATLLVAVGTTLSAFWILVLNSWMQTPAGYEIRDGVIHAANWAEIIFNPSMPYRIGHKLLASGLTAAFLVAGLSAYQYLRGDHRPGVTAALKTGVYLAALLIPVQIFVGDLHGLNSFKYQPAKVAAMEGIWETERGAALRLFAVPDEENRMNHYEVKIPYVTSLILTHEMKGEVRGLNEFEFHPPVAPVFYAFRIMIGTGMLMLAVSWFTAFGLLRGKEPNRIALYALACMIYSGWIATVAGWYVTEIGRQPWIVTGLLKAKDAVGDVPGSYVALTLTIYLIVYLVMITAFIGVVYRLARMARHENEKVTKLPAM
jgi:cytochrome bd ubiquinol oxidase subunit I